MTSTRDDTPAAHGTGEAGERGRYALYATPAGPVIARVTGLCDRCLDCGCGDQQTPIELTPAGVMRLIRDNNITLPSPRDMLKMLGGRNAG